MAKSKTWSPTLVGLAVIVALVAVGAVAGGWYYRLHERTLSAGDAAAANESAAHDAHPAHDDHDALDLSEQAKGNIGLEVRLVRKQDYQKATAVPATIVEQPGVSRHAVSAPLTGIVTSVHRTQGESVRPGELLFQMRLTHEDLVVAQREFLARVEELDVVNQEIDRLDEATESGAIAGKTLLAREYEKKKIVGALRALRESLLLHGLTNAQVDSVLERRELVKSFEILAPAGPVVQGDSLDLYTLSELRVHVGQHVEAGEQLAMLSDYRLLYVEGKAFEHDAPQLEQAAAGTAQFGFSFDTGVHGTHTVAGLNLVYVANEIEAGTRALHFYLELPNELIDVSKRDSGRRFARWKYRPGQRGQVLIPSQSWRDKIVLPADAVVEDGVESFVFVRHRSHYDRRKVRVLDRDQEHVILDYVPSLLREGEEVVTRGAYLMHLAIKSQAGGGIDPHAGHNH